MGELADRITDASTSSRAKLGKLADLLDRSGIPIEEIGRVEKVNVWQGFYKDDEGEAHTVDMAGLTLVPTWADGPAWPVVQQAAPTVVRFGSKPSARTSERTTLILPDTQIGYRRMEDGSLEPIHDEQAMAAGLEVARLIHPHRIVNLGDYLDLAQWSSKFLVTPEFYFTTQPAIDRGHLYLAEQRAIVGPGGEVVLFGGNHDNRMALAIARNAAEALRLRRANLPESWPVMSMPHLLRLDELGVEYIGAYPAGKKKLADAHGRQTPLYARHGTGAGDVRKDARGLRQSFVQGHGHHLSVHAETYEVDDEPQDVEVWSLGCLCRLDGWVNSTKSGEHDNGRPFKQWESWQHAVGIVTEFDGGGWDVQAIRIRDGRAVVNGRQVAA